ncbi:MAG: sensor histidine kinase [Acidimicrobiales bacterium]
MRPLVATVRFRITALATAAVVATLLTAGFSIVTLQRRLLSENLKDSIEQRSQDVAGLVTAGRLPEVLAGGEDTLVQVTGRGGVILASPGLADRPPMAGAVQGRVESIQTIEGLLGPGENFRVLSRRVEGPDGVVVHVAGSLGDLEESTRDLTIALAAVVPATGMVLAALIWWIVGRTLSLVEAIRSDVAEIGGRDLRRRVIEPDGDDEIARLARTMNAMLERVEDASLRQQAFVADASHELRSPLARIRSELEVDLLYPATADPRATHRSVLAEVDGLAHLVEDLLHLARSDGTTGLRRDDPVDLDDIVFGVVERARPASKVAFDVTGVTAAQVRGDAGLLSRAVANLLDNSVRHATGSVSLSLAENQSEAVLTVADDGTGIPAERREWVFERFTRVDDARHRATGGSGLGLAITRDIIDRHGGTVIVDPDFGPGARFVVTLPLFAGDESGKLNDL